MIHLFLAGAWRVAPDRVGAWAYELRRDGGLPETGAGRSGPPETEGRLSAEAAALALGLERAAGEGGGEEAVVRTASAALVSLLGAGGAGADRALGRWLGRAAEAASRLASVRVLAATTRDLAGLRARAEDLLPAGGGIVVARASEVRSFGRRLP